MEYPWLASTLTTMGELLKLDDYWDTYGAPKIDPGCVLAVLDFLFAAMQDDTPSPHVAPTSEGGVQIEWHTGMIDLEIEFFPNEEVACFYDTGDMSESFEDEDVTNLAALHPLVRKLAKPKGEKE